MAKNLVMCSLSLGSFTSCKKPYDPKAVAINPNLLVVDGVINAGSDSTIITLSRSVNIATVSTVNAETKAIVSVEDDQSANYPLVEVKPGSYANPGLNLDTSHTYRLIITTSDQQHYVSDFEHVKITPPIDSVGFIVNSDNVSIYVNTHDPHNNTRYYRWSYTETWQFHAKYFSMYYTNGHNIKLRDDNGDQNIYDCFASDTANSGVLGSSAKLSQDVIDHASITTIASTSEKIETKYSILVKQYALTADAYNFYENLQKNTEQLGSIFDAQPSNINGNLHNMSDPSQPVIGFVGVCTVASKRIFISKLQVVLTWITTYPFDCEEVSVYTDNSGFYNVQRNLIPLNSTLIPTSSSDTTKGYGASTKECVDCRIRGTKTTPSFWQ